MQPFFTLLHLFHSYDFNENKNENTYPADNLRPFTF